MTEQEIIKMGTIGEEHEGHVVTVVGVPSHQGTDTAAAHARVWLQDGVAVEALFDQKTWDEYGSAVYSSAVLVRGRVEWYRPGPGSEFLLVRLWAEYAEAYELVSITTEAIY